MWDVILRGSRQLRMGAGSMPLGYDLAALLTIAVSLGYDERALIYLFHHAERGMIAGTYGNSNHEKHLDPSGGDRR